LLRVRLPGSVDDPNVDSLEPFRLSPDRLPDEARARFHVAHQELQALGFHSPVCYWIHDVKHQTDIYQAVYLHDSGQAVARVHYRVWHFTKPAKEYFFPVFVTAFTDGTYLISTAGKRDILAPPACRENRRVAATATSLWDSHQKTLQEELLFKTVRPVRNEYELLEAVESHHATVRDFHVDRGVFVPMTEEEQQRVTEAAQAATEAVSQGEVPSATPAILEEIEKLQNKRSGWGAGVILLLVSVGLFFAFGAAVWPWGFVAMLLPILFFHELGHYAAMRLFHYSNVKMFFIPLLGAAVSGRHYNVPGWKKVVVSLAGPLPGIFLATALGIAGIFLQIGWLQQAALLAVFLNGFNLLPILPLDGGWVMHTLLFSRHYILDAGFRVLAVVVLLAGSHLSGDRFLFFFGLMMAAGLPVAFRMAGVVTALRRKGVQAASPDGHSVPPETAQVIAEEVRGRFRQGLTNRNVAQFTLQAFEALNARPPGVVATILLGSVYVGSFVFALLALAGLAVGLPMFVNRDSSPEHPIQVDQIEAAGLDPDGDVPESELAVVATFSSNDEAIAQFTELRKQLPANTVLLRFGRSLLVTVPPDGQVTTEQWKSRFARRTREVADGSDNCRLFVSIVVTAPSEEVAAQIQEALQAYDFCPLSMIPKAPWHPLHGPTSEEQEARTLYGALSEAEWMGNDPDFDQLSRQYSEALRNGNRDRCIELEEEQEALRKSIWQKRIDRILKETSEPRQRELIELYQSRPIRESEPEALLEPGQPEPEAVLLARRRAQEEHEQRLNAWEAELAEVLGGIPNQNLPMPGADRFGVNLGDIERNGCVVQIHGAQLTRPVNGAPALVRWLDELGCTEIKYLFY